MHPTVFNMGRVKIRGGRFRFAGYQQIETEWKFDLVLDSYGLDVMRDH